MSDAMKPPTVPIAHVSLRGIVFTLPSNCRVERQERQNTFFDACDRPDGVLKLMFLTSSLEKEMMNRRGVSLHPPPFQPTQMDHAFKIILVCRRVTQDDGADAGKVFLRGCSQHSRNVGEVLGSARFQFHQNQPGQIKTGLALGGKPGARQTFRQPGGGAVEHIQDVTFRQSPAFTWNSERANPNGPAMEQFLLRSVRIIRVNQNIRVQGETRRHVEIGRAGTDNDKGGAMKNGGQIHGEKMRSLNGGQQTSRTRTLAAQGKGEKLPVCAAFCPAGSGKHHVAIE